jgi:hypothetical protein
MAIYRLMREAAFSPEDISRMTAAYESVLSLLHLKDRTDPLTEMIATKIIEVTRNGERDPAHICARTVKELGVSVPE